MLQNYFYFMLKMFGYILYKLKLKSIFLVVGTSSLCFYLIQIILIPYLKGRQNDYPIMIWWTPLMPEEDRIINCHHHSCLLTKNRHYINNTNLQAFLFYGSQFNIWDLPVPKKKIWAIFHEESPRNVALFLYNRTYDIFDLTATFSRYSDFPLTLQYLENLSILTSNQYLMKVEDKNKLLSEIAPVLYIQSDCDTPVDRDAYVSEIMKYVQVDSYGACLNNKKFPPEIAEIYSLDLYNNKLLRFIAKYKFVIAFENGICDDYITEKLWRPLFTGTVPIYLGSPSVQDWLPNKNSVILAKNFQSPELLTKHINEINLDDSLYEKFREHKRGKVENVLLERTLAQGPFGLAKDQEHPISAFECFVCEQIHKGVKKRRTHSVYDCVRPSKTSSWHYYWQSGDCQSRALVNHIRNNAKLDVDSC